MGKKIRLHLTGIGSVLSEAAEKKIDKDTDETPVCNEGYNRDWYETMGIKEAKIPQELKDREKVFNRGVKLEDEDFEEVQTFVLVYEDMIELMVEDEGITTIFLKSGLTIDVLETVEEIDDYIDYLQMSWFRKNYLLLSTFLSRIRGTSAHKDLTKL